jgi:hypothetical protein
MSALLQRDLLVGPAFGVVTVDAVDLDAAALNEVGHNIDHPPRLEVFRAAHLVREDEHWTAPMPVGDH